MDIHKAGSIAFKNVGNIQDVFIQILYNNSGIQTGKDEEFNENVAMRVQVLKRNGGIYVKEQRTCRLCNEPIV